MKYLRVVFAINDEDVERFRNEVLDIFIESDDAEAIGGRITNPISGAYVSAPYDTRTEAIHQPTYREASS